MLKMFIQWVILLFIFGPLDADFLRSSCVLPRLEHGHFKIRQRARLVQYTCEKNYTLVGNKYATCRDGEWDVPTPVCIRPGCKVQSVENGLSLTNFDDAWVIYFCLPGHKLVGSHVLYCNGRRWNGTVPACVDSTTVSELSCDFESPSICGWTQDELHDFDWKRLNKKTPSSFLMTGPSYDHTYGKGGSGYYMYIESTSRLENDTARLISPVYKGSRTKNGCFSFFYHMYGNSSGGLRVYQKPVNLELQSIVNNSPDGKRYMLFEKWGNLGDFWFNDVVPLTKMDTNFQIIIEGIRGPSFMSDIAIDDVAILQGENCTSAMIAASTPPSFRSDSCLNRCFLNDTMHLVGCGCTSDCIMEENCCLDFLENCVFIIHQRTRTISDDMVSDSTDVAPQTQKLIAAITETTSTTSSTTTSTTTTTPKPTTTRRTTTTTTPKPTTVRTTTTTTTTTTTPRPPVTTTTKRATTKRVFTTTPKTTTQISTSTVASKTTTKKVVVTKPTTTTTMSTTTTSTNKPSTTSSTKATTKFSKSVENGKVSFLDKENMKQTIETRKLEHLPQKGEEHSSSAWKVILTVICIIALVGTLSGATYARSTRGRIAIAKFCGHVRVNDPEVRYLSTDVDDD